MTTLMGGPWSEHGSYWRTRFTSQLKESESEGSAIQGWRTNGVRERIDQFLASQLDHLLVREGVDTSKRILIHGDLSRSTFFSYAPTQNVTLMTFAC